MKRLSFLLALALLSALVATGAAQQKPSKPAKTQPPAKTETKVEHSPEAELSLLEQRGLILLRRAGEEAASLDDRRNGSRIQAEAADALWPRDQELARKLFEQAIETAFTYYRDSKDDNLIRVTRGSSTSRPDARLEVIRLVNRHDSKLGREFTERYIEEKRREEQERRNKSDTIGRGDEQLFGKEDATASDLLRVANSLLEFDLKAAVELGQRAFALGVPREAPGFLAQLARRDRAAADELYLSAIERLRANPAALPSQLLLLSAYPFGDNMVHVSDGGNTYGMSFGSPEGFAVNPQLIQRFISAAFAILSRIANPEQSLTADSASRFNSASFAARVIEPKVAQHQAALLPDWRVLAGQLFALSTDQAREGIERAAKQATERGADRGRSGPPPDNEDQVKRLLDRAQNASDFNQRDALYQQAAITAGISGKDLTRGLEIADKIANFDFRRKVRSWILFSASQQAVQEKRLDDARRFALEVDATDQRAYLFFQIASAALKDKDRFRAAEILHEAAQQATAADNTPEKLRALSGIAHLYAGIDPQRAFEVAAEAVRAANRVPTYGPGETRLLRSLETPGGQGSYLSVNDVREFDLGKMLAVLARTDFDGALLLAESLENKSLRLAAIVTLAASVFDKKQVAQVQ